MTSPSSRAPRSGSAGTAAASFPPPLKPRQIRAQALADARDAVTKRIIYVTGQCLGTTGDEILAHLKAVRADINRLGDAV